MYRPKGSRDGSPPPESRISLWIPHYPGHLLAVSLRETNGMRAPVASQ